MAEIQGYLRLKLIRPASVKAGPAAVWVQQPISPAEVSADPPTSGKKEINSATEKKHDSNSATRGKNRTAKKSGPRPRAPLALVPKPEPEPNFATRGKNQIKANSATRGRKPNVDGFSWDRVKHSKNTWAYRVRPSGVNSATGKRHKPIYVRYLSDEAAVFFERKEKDAIKRLVSGWYDDQIRGQKSGTGD